MKTRRGFLNTSSLAIAVGLPVRSLAGRAVSSENEPASTALGDRDYWNDYPKYLTSVINKARARRLADLAEVKAAKDAFRRSQLVRKKIWELIGGPLEKTPLNVKAVGTIERDDYRIEKLIFESQPEFYVPAHLYVPKKGKGPFPGIIAPLGHANDGKVFRSYQTVFQNLARKGFVVLTWDPPGQGERLQNPIPGMTKSRFGSTGEHAQFGYPAFLIGSTTTQFETWDAVRAIDYLETRQDVDASRIGCCGHSGGGTATMYLCALELRIKAAITVEGHVENVAGANYEPPGAYADAEQNIIGSLKLNLDRGDLLGAFAPKALLICFTHSDVGATYSPHYELGTREIYKELKDLYSLHDAADKVALFASGLPHDYDFFHRKATYGWFNRWLREGAGDDTEVEFDEAPIATLNCTSTGLILTSVGGRTAYQVNFDRLRTIKEHRPSAGFQKSQLQQNLKQVLGFPYEGGPMRSKVLGTQTTPELVFEEFEYNSEPGIRVPGWFIKPAAADAKVATIVMISSSGKSRLFDELGLLAEITKQKIAICAIEPRAGGRATPRFPVSGPLFYSHSGDMAYPLVSLTAGMPLAGQRTWDLMRCIDYLHTRQDVDTSRIGLFGRGAYGLEAIYGAGLDERFRTILLEKTLTDFESLIAVDDHNLKAESFTFGLLKHFDLPEICATFSPRPVWLLNSVNAKGEALAASEISERYAVTAKAYANHQHGKQLAVHVEPAGGDKVFAEWVKNTLA